MIIGTNCAGTYKVGVLTKAEPFPYYRTPWCEMLGGCSTTQQVLHLWYTLTELSSEIEKRTAFLGKFRRTEEAAHLQDLIVMTNDEQALFDSFSRAAMADVFDRLCAYTDTTPWAYRYNEGTDTLEYDKTSIPATVPTFEQGQWVHETSEDKLYIAAEDGNVNETDKLLEQVEDFRLSVHYIISYPRNKNINMVQPLDTAVKEALVSRIIYKWLCLSYPDEAKQYLLEYAEAMDAVRTRCDVFNPHVLTIIPNAF